MPRLEELTSVLMRFEGRIPIYVTKNNVEISATHTGKYSKYDFAVGLKYHGQHEFFPTHVRLIIDLYLKIYSESCKSKKLFSAFEEIFKGEGPEVFKELETLNFSMQLDNSYISLCYGQLLMIEQDFNYAPVGGRKSRHFPPREFLMCFIRWIASKENEIDKIVTAAVRNYPPPSKFKDLDCRNFTY